MAVLGKNGNLVFTPIFDSSWISSTRESGSSRHSSRKCGSGGTKWGHPQILVGTGRTTPPLVRLTIMTLAWSTSDRAKATRADGEHLSMALDIRGHPQS